MKSILSNRKEISDNLIRDIISRDAALWIGEFPNATDEISNCLINLMRLPWRFVLCESCSSSLAKIIDLTSNQPSVNDRISGNIHIVSSSPEQLILPPRSLPIYFLNGRSDKEGIEGTSLGSILSQKRRLNMLDVLITNRPRSLAIVTFGAKQPLDDFFSLWNEAGLRSWLSFFTSSNDDSNRFSLWLNSTTDILVDNYTLSYSDFIDSLSSKVNKNIPDQKIMVNIRIDKSTNIDLDITDCDLIERPIFDRYELIQSKDIVPLMPDQLSKEDLCCFFDRSKNCWTPYAAGLPWDRNPNAKESLRRAIDNIFKYGSEKNKILYIFSESGAGGTTLARNLAFEIAKAGYPSLLAKEIPFKPSATEIESFLLRVRQTLMNQNLGIDKDYEIPFLIVYDSLHWAGREEELKSFFTNITNRKRKVVILCVITDKISEELDNFQFAECIETLKHDITLDQALHLGKHLNNYLKIHGMTKREYEWKNFWEMNKPEIDIPIAPFWIALEFWVKGQIDLSVSIQKWLYTQFKGLEISNNTRHVLLEIAALSIERASLPETILPIDKSLSRPISILLDDIKHDAPALGLYRLKHQGNWNWFLIHSQLGRYLINSLYSDSKMRAELGFADSDDPVHMRLLLLRRIALRSELGLKIYSEFARSFAVRILKLDVGDAAEFFKHWRLVLSILDEMDSSLRKSNRSFIHHVAISRRRVATLDQIFQTSLNEKKDLLENAVNQLEYALKIPKIDDDESDLNILNTLSLSYQNLAQVEGQLGASQKRIIELRLKATDAARKAQLESPNNSYVLETYAKNLLQEALLVGAQAVENAAESFFYIYQAMRLDRAISRHHQLSRLANKALSILLESKNITIIDDLCKNENPFGYIAKAWTILFANQNTEYLEIASIDDNLINEALNILDNSPNKDSWLILGLRYDLISKLRPNSFDEQLQILDEITGTRYNLSPQLLLERAILLHQCNRHYDANQLDKNLRKYLKDYEIIVQVPERLRWLLATDHKNKRICHAQVIDTGSFRSYAKVSDLQNAIVPFIPQDFGERMIAVASKFACYITFGPMGPFIKPTQEKGK